MISFSPTNKHRKLPARYLLPPSFWNPSFFASVPLESRQLFAFTAPARGRGSNMHVKNDLQDDGRGREGTNDVDSRGALHPAFGRIWDHGVGSGSWGSGTFLKEFKLKGDG